jgi:parallel beta-helix repeat protein
VTVTNPNSRGYGLWIENASPAIANNTLLDNQQDGALITGQSTAIVSTNQFFRNGTSGLAIEGAASPNIRQNLFQQTTYGMSIRQDSTPQVTENTFTQNQNGILIQASAKPILRGNAVINNRDYGLTISDTARPDLGKINDDGNNIFQGNGTFDIQNATRERVAAIGNQLDAKRVKGNLQLLNVRSPSTQQLEQKIASPNFNSLNFNSLSSLASSNTPDQANSPFWSEPVNSVVVRITSRSLETPAPNKLEITRDLPPIRAFPPSGEPVNQPIQIAPRENTSMTPQIPPRYRVVVTVDSPNAVAQVRQIMPNSFASRLNGYLVVQIGAYSDRRIAEVQVSRLAQQGLSARIEAIKP